jgi:hypothetical protein
MKKTNPLVIFSVCILAAVSVALVSTTYAEEPRDFEKENGLKMMNTKIKELFKSKREEVKENTQERIQKRCENVNNLIDNRIKMLEKTHRLRQDQYQDFVTRIEDLISRVKTKGADTSQLETDLETLKTKVANVETEYTALLALVAETKNKDCGNTEGEFKNGLVKSREQLQNVVSASLDVRDYLHTVIKPDLNALRDSLKALKNPEL